MKKAFFLFLLPFTLIFSYGFAKPMVGEKAPSFQIQTEQGRILFPKDFLGQWVLFFSVPNIKTPVCTLELIKCLQMIPEWKSLHCRPILVTCHEEVEQQEWLSTTLQEMKEEGEIVADSSYLRILPDHERKIAYRYQMIHPKVSEIKPLRATYLIDPKGVLRFISFSPMKNGRNFGEIARILAAIQKTDEDSKNVTPPDWQKGEEPITCVPCSQGVK